VTTSPFKKLEAQIEQDIRGWFKDHIATHKPASIDGMDVYSWRKPGTGINSIDYTVKGSYLICTGDQGDAIYQWSQPVTVYFLGGLDLSYFTGKCRASSCRSMYGHPGEEWFPEKAFETACFHLDERGLRLGHRVIGKKLAKVHMGIRDLEEACNDPHNWHQLLADFGHELYGDYCELGGIGYAPSFRTRAHLIGLSMLCAQMLSREAA